MDAALGLMTSMEACAGFRDPSAYNEVSFYVPLVVVASYDFFVSIFNR